MTFKNLLSLLLATCFCILASAQQSAYNNAWKKIDSLLEKRGLTASAMREVDKIYARAKKEKNNAQLIKALIYKVRIQETVQEDATQKNIALLEKEMGTVGQPAKSILQSIAASQYWNYYRQIRWRLYNRTETVNFNKTDIATWSADDFHKRIGELFLASISNERLLQQTRLAAYEPIIVKGNVRHLRPTLFDLLAHRALDYFRTDERMVTQPAYAFEIDDPVALADAAAFARHTFTTRDSLSLSFRALELYQQLIRFHLNDAKPDALLDADIQRLQFVYDNGVMESKEELYRQTLERITGKYGQLPVAAQAWYLLASWHAEKAASYDPQTNRGDRYAYRQAKAICERVVAQKDTSEGWVNCRNLLNRITQPSFQLQTEKVNVPGQPFRTLVSWRNMPQLHFRIVPVDRKTLESLTAGGTHEESYWEKLIALPVLRRFSQSLPDARDHQEHHAEIKIDALPPGRYALLGSMTNEFGLKKNPMAVQFFYVSNISWIQKDQEFFALHRQTGQPLAKANVQVWYLYYDSRTRRYAERKGENVVTGSNGYFRIAPARTQGDNNYQLQVTIPGDELFLQDFQYLPVRPIDPEQRVRKSTFLFTDRSIYRPGQTVYVKGIVITRDTKNDRSEVVPEFSTTLFLQDANGQKIDSVKVKSSEFGSYSARFTLPTGSLNGNFIILDGTTQDAASISVEEYKRPRFFAEIAQPAGAYRLNDTISVTGSAKAYAGNTIDGAVVKYRVTRQTVMPFWFYRSSKMIWPPYGREEMEITHGETTTDANGNFRIVFKAIPDKDVDKKDQPVFHYTITADVTDVAGETRSANTSVSVAYQALQLKLGIPERVHADSLRSIDLSSTNLADSFVKATVTLRMHPLQTPERLFRLRYWQQPDTFVMSRDEYYRHFPYDVYADETDPSRWLRGTKIAEQTDTTSITKKFGLRDARLSPGWYVVEAIAKDKYGEEVKAIQYVQVYTNNPVSGPLASVEVDGGTQALQPGQSAHYAVSTNLDNAYVIHERAWKNEGQERDPFVLNRNTQSFDMPITEAHRGGLGVLVATVKHNRVYTDYQVLPVPYTNKELKVSYATWRNKTLPGSQEKWTVTIHGYKGEKVAAELLTAMYDASLDQFKPHSWTTPSLWSRYYPDEGWNGRLGFTYVQSQERRIPLDYVPWQKEYDVLLADEGHLYTVGNRRFRMRGEMPVAYEVSGMADAAAPPAAEQSVGFTSAKRTDATASDSAERQEETAGEARQPAAQVRKNFNETAFFFPDLKTDEAGNITFSFTMPEAVTQWKWMSMAHTKELAFGYSEKTIVTQKDLMVQPNAPRFLREGDRMDFSAKIANITDKEMTGQVELQLIDPATGTAVDGWFHNMFPNQYFTVAAGQSVPVSFSITIPFKYNRPVTYKVIARSGNVSDGEEATLPVLTNRMLVTESMPLPLRGQASKSFTFDKLLQSNHSETLDHQAVTVEFTSNPAWYAVQALPYLMDYPYECSEQVFNRYYANALAASIANASPRLKEIFERWKNADTAALLSNLQKNAELKSVLLQETPWVLQAKSETEQKRNIALLFDMVRMGNELQSALTKLKDMQLPNGGFPWFQGGPDDRYITQYILTGIGHLTKLNALQNDVQVKNIVRTAIPYADLRILEQYQALLKQHKNKEPEQGSIGYFEIQYLYMRSFFPDMAMPQRVQKAYQYYRKQAQKEWLKQSRYMQGMIALALHRTGDAATAKNIVASLKENALANEEMGMYWKENTGGYYWYQAPVEAQALLIETFTEVTKDIKAVDDLKTWLLKQKQTQHWRTTKATADACYALLLQGSDWLTNTPEVTIRIGSQTIRSSDQGGEAGTGYFKKTIEGRSVNADMGNIEVFVKGQTSQTSARPSWGAVYWQYFEDLDKITPASTPLKLSKKLFIEKNSDRGPVLQPLNEGDVLNVGDKVTVRIELRSDRNLEYVHMKDMRAACMEPVNVLSHFKWQQGLGYYETTKDASTNFFFGRLPKGTFVFEYSLFVTHTGTFSNGVTSIQCMYAPEFTSHSEGVKVRVEEKSAGGQ